MAAQQSVVKKESRALRKTNPSFAAARSLLQELPLPSVTATMKFIAVSYPQTIQPERFVFDKALCKIAGGKAGDAFGAAAQVRLIGKTFLQFKLHPVKGQTGFQTLPRAEKYAFRSD